MMLKKRKKSLALGFEVYSLQDSDRQASVTVGQFSGKEIGKFQLVDKDLLAYFVYISRCLFAEVMTQSMTKCMPQPMNINRIV